MAASSALTRFVLRRAVASGDAEAYLDSLDLTAASLIESGGMQMTSVSSAGKAYAFANGYTPTQIMEASVAARRMLLGYTEEQITTYLNRPASSVAVLKFR